MGVTLDCSSIETATASLAALLRLSDEELRGRLVQVVVDWSHESIAPENQILIGLGLDPNAPPKPSAVRWFHATRAAPGTEYSEGLLPTSDAVSRLWNVLGRCASQWLSTDHWEEYRRSFDRGDRAFSAQFRQKKIVSGWDGPFAFLVRDAAVGKHGGHKDFTQLSEAVEDICADSEQVHGRDLRTAYQVATQACLVVFTTPGGHWGTVRAAANYAFRAVHGLDCGLDCNANYSGKGRAVPRDWIDRIEWL